MQVMGEGGELAIKKGPQAPTLGFIGGAEEDRTPDLRIANATLSQLSYGTISEHCNTQFRHSGKLAAIVEAL